MRLLETYHLSQTLSEKYDNIMTKKIVSFIGFAGSGKNACAEIAQRDFGYELETFARSVKDAVALIFGYDRDMLEGITEESRIWREKTDPFWTEKLKFSDFSPRKALQLMGTEAGRDVFGEDLWVHTTFSRINKAPPDTKFVIADTRFPNEIDEIRKNNGLLVRVKRGPEPVWFDTAKAVAKEKPRWGMVDFYHDMARNYPEIHYSEWAWTNAEFDATIENDGSLEDLREKVVRILNE